MLPFFSFSPGHNSLLMEFNGHYGRLVAAGSKLADRDWFSQQDILTQHSENKRSFHRHQWWWIRGQTCLFFPSSLCIISVLVFKGATKPWLVTNREGWEVAAWCLASAPSWSSSQSGERHCFQWRWASSRGLQGKTDPHKSVCLKDQTTEFYSPSISALMSQRRQSTRERDRERQRKSSA